MVSPLGQHVAIGERKLAVGAFKVRGIAELPAGLTGRRAVIRRQIERSAADVGGEITVERPGGDHFCSRLSAR